MVGADEVGIPIVDQRLVGGDDDPRRRIEQVRKFLGGNHSLPIVFRMSIPGRGSVRCPSRESRSPRSPDSRCGRRHRHRPDSGGRCRTWRQPGGTVSARDEGTVTGGADGISTFSPPATWILSERVSRSIHSPSVTLRDGKRVSDQPHASPEGEERHYEHGDEKAAASPHRGPTYRVRRMWPDGRLL